MTQNLPEITNPNMPSTTEFQMLQVIAKNAEDSGLYGGVGQKAKILMVLLAARELGISPMIALNGGIWNIQGKVEISARLMNGMIRRAGHTLQIRSTDKECTIIGKRSDTGEEHTELFTIDMATRAGLVRNNKDGSPGIWMKYPEDMLYNRCMSRLARRLFPDVIGTAYVEGEIQESKESEKRLPVADYEDVTLPNIVEPPVEPKINEQQLANILEGVSKVDDTFLANYKSYMLEKWNVTEYEDLPLRAYGPTMTSVQRNIEMNAKKVLDADIEA